MATNMLTDTRIRQAKPAEKSYKLTDGDGMYLLVDPAGNRYWRLNYRFADKHKTLALGTYPEISLDKARKAMMQAWADYLDKLKAGAEVISLRA